MGWVVDTHHHVHMEGIRQLVRILSPSNTSVLGIQPRALGWAAGIFTH